ncbi:hypothetical protein ACFX2I_020168 [Malus domestica]
MRLPNYILEDNVSGKLLSPSCSSLHLSNLHPQQYKQHYSLNSSFSSPKASVLSVQTSWPCPPLLKLRCFRTCSGVPTLYHHPDRCQTTSQSWHSASLSPHSSLQDRSQAEAGPREVRGKDVLRNAVVAALNHYT